MPARTWTPMRLWSLITAIICGLLVVATYISSHAYTGEFRSTPEFWLLVSAMLAATVAHVGAHVRDSITEGQRQIRQALDDLPLHIVDYGDRREVAGHQLATRVGATQRGRLTPVE